LRARLRNGDPDMPPDELQPAVDRAETKRAELLASQLAAKASAKVLTMLPRAAAAYRRQIAESLSGDVRAAARARAAIRQLVGGKIILLPDRKAGHSGRQL
jgi:site-specific DNA recombinase